MRYRGRFRNAVRLAIAVAFTGLLHASSPTSGTINTPQDDNLGTKQTLTYAAGPFAAGSLAGTQTSDTVAICTQEITPPAICDVFSVSLNLPADYWQSRRGTLEASVKWADAPDGNDLDLYIVDEEGTILSSSTNDNTVSASETASITNPPTGPRTLRVVTVNWLSPVPIASASGTVTFNLVPTATDLPPEPTPPSFAPRFFNHYPPGGMGEHAGEPTLGINGRTGNVMFVAWLETLRASFDDSGSPARATWSNKSFLLTTQRSNDPILFTDAETGRTFVSQLMFPSKQSLSAYTSDDGESWQISQGSGINSGVDHQTIGGGRMPSGLVTLDPNYPNAVYYAAQDIAVAEFALSLDGGRTYGPAIPMYTIADCAGLHGHIKVSPADGTAYVPLGSCGGLLTAVDGQQAVALTHDGGFTWTLSRIPGSKASTWDPAVGVSTGGVVYFGYGDNLDRTPRVAVSRDRGASWTVGPDVGASHGIKRIAFPAMVAGDDDRAAFAFLGTRYDGEALGSGANFEGTWSAYVSTTYDGGKTWVTVNASGEDPVQRGNICDAGLSCPGTPNTRNLLDFMDVDVDARGRILVAYADGCVTPACVSGADKNGDGLLNARDNDFADKGVIARQTGGRGLSSAFDPPDVAPPAAPQLGAALQGQSAMLAWSTPDDGGSPITGYRVYRNDALAASVGGDANTFTDGSTSASTSYRVSALNAAGEGPRSTAVIAVVPPSACKVPGIQVADDAIDMEPNRPLQPALDLRRVHLAEPFGAGGGMLHFTVETGGGAPSPNSMWYVIWQRTTPDATHDRNYVAMKTDLLGRPSFEHGRISYPVSTGSPAANQGNIPTRVGAAAGSYDAATGTLRIQVPTAAVDDVGAGDTLLGIEGRTFLARNDSLPVNQNLTSDFAVGGGYTLVGNASCENPPAAPTSLTGTATKGHRTVVLSWIDNAADETGYIVERSLTADGGFSELTTLQANASGYTDATVVKKNTYFYRVRALRGSARSAYSNVASVQVK